MGNPGVQVHVCPNCDKHWCYTTPKCKNEGTIKFCEVCDEPNSKMKAATPSPNNKDCDAMSPITTHCDPVIARQLFDKLTNLRQLKFDYEASHTHWKECLADHFTHLHYTEDNLFSPNRASPNPVNGMFLSFDDVDKLLIEDETQMIITDELIKFIVDLLNFQQEYALTAKGYKGKGPEKILFDTKGKNSRLHTLMLLVTNNDDKQYYTPLSLLEIINSVWVIAKAEGNEWFFDPEDRNLERNGALWRRLFQSSTSMDLIRQQSKQSSW